MDIIAQRHKVIEADVQSLLSKDPVFSKYLHNNLHIDRVLGEPTMGSLIRIVIGQQISNKVAQNLWAKLKSDIDPNNPTEILKISDEQLKSYGLSRQKITYVRGLATAVENKEIDIASWTLKDSDKVTAEITSLKGFGPWSAQIFLLFHLCDPTIWPSADLGIQIGLQKYFQMDSRPNEKESLAMKNHFVGQETAASFCLWALKGDEVKL